MKTLLSQHPWIGFLSSLLGSALPLIQFLTPYLQFIGLLVGVLVGIITLVGEVEKRTGKK